MGCWNFFEHYHPHKSYIGFSSEYFKAGIEKKAAKEKKKIKFAIFGLRSWGVLFIKKKKMSWDKFFSGNISLLVFHFPPVKRLLSGSYNSFHNLEIPKSLKVKAENAFSV